MKKLLLLVLVAVSIQGCANYQKISASYIEGCEAEEITISNNGATGLFSRAWQAECNGVKHTCYMVQKSQYITKTDCIASKSDES